MSEAWDQLKQRVQEENVRMRAAFEHREQEQEQTRTDALVSIAESLATIAKLQSARYASHPGSVVQR